MLVTYEYTATTTNNTYIFPGNPDLTISNREVTLDEAREALAMWMTAKMSDEYVFTREGHFNNYEIILQMIYVWSWIVWALENPRGPKT